MFFSFFYSDASSINTICSRNKVTLPKLLYDYKDLEPIVSRDIMELHHSKHHAAYVNNYNLAEEKLQDAISKGMTKLIYYVRINKFSKTFVFGKC